MESSKKIITSEEWEAEMKDANIQKEFMNSVVMDLLVYEGFLEAAKIFQKESGIEPELDLTDVSITGLVAVINAIKSKNLEDAMNRLNAINPEILEEDFHLKKQKLIDLISQEETEEAFAFTRDELAPCAQKNAAFDNSQWFRSQTGLKGPKLQYLLNKLSWTQVRLDIRASVYPHMDFSTGYLAPK